MASLYRALIVAPIMLIISLILINRIYMVFSYIVLAIIPFLVIIFVCIIFKNYFLSTQKQKVLEQINSKLRENLTGIKVIKTLNTENYECSKFNAINSQYAFLNINLFNSIFSMEPLFYLLLNVSIIFTTGFGAYILKLGMPADFHLGGLYNCINLQYHILYSILNFLLLFTMFPKALVSLRKIEHLLNTKSEIKNNLQYNFDLSKPIVSLEFKNVDFRYDQNDKLILSDINFKVHSSELIALVGSTGSGKSTLINLIPRLIDPTKGCLLINGEEPRHRGLHAALRCQHMHDPRYASVRNGGSNTAAARASPCWKRWWRWRSRALPLRSCSARSAPDLAARAGRPCMRAHCLSR
ncbi:MAG: ATP-binding cassette domain-containing protein, partial [Candidatus Phytoplasma australasiaticum]|nr:ATP-binding cassette domain-containing protein [Candidatus Phytoplasma australasiaticum]